MYKIYNISRSTIKWGWHINDGFFFSYKVNNEGGGCALKFKQRI